MQLSSPIIFNSYYLIKPFIFKKTEERITSIPDGYSLLKTSTTGICASDLHYFLGKKSREKLQKRLPLILLHEGICEDVLRGTRVVPIAANLNTVISEYKGRENIYPAAKYMGATAHGMAREYFLYPQELTVPVSSLIENNVATLIEPLSIVLKSLKDIDIRYHHEVAIIGDGALAYLFALMLHFYVKLPQSHIHIYGVHDEKLQKFSRFGATYNVKVVPKFKSTDVVFEVVGGSKVQDTFDFALQLARPGATIGVVGVSDEFPKLNINQIVNHGIRIVGLTRSTYEEYIQMAEFLANTEFHKAVKEFIFPKTFTISSVHDLTTAFNKAKDLKTHGRIVLEWNKK